MNATKRIAQIFVLLIILAACQDVVRRNLVAAEESAIAPANIDHIYAQKFDGHAFVTVVLGIRSEDSSCEPGPRVKIVYQYYPTLGEPQVQEYSPDQPPSRPGCEIDWQAAEQFAASLHLFLDSEGEEISVGPIEGMYTAWDILYNDILIIQAETLDMQQVFMPIVIR